MLLARCARPTLNLLLQASRTLHANVTLATLVLTAVPAMRVLRARTRVLWVALLARGAHQTRFLPRQASPLLIAFLPPNPPTPTGIAVRDTRDRRAGLAIRAPKERLRLPLAALHAQLAQLTPSHLWPVSAFRLAFATLGTRARMVVRVRRVIRARTRIPEVVAHARDARTTQSPTLPVVAPPIACLVRGFLM